MSHLSPEHRIRRVDAIDRSVTDPGAARFRVWYCEGSAGRGAALASETTVLGDVAVGNALSFMADGKLTTTTPIKTIIERGGDSYEVYTANGVYTLDRVPSAELSVTAEREIASRSASARWAIMRLFGK